MLLPSAMVPAVGSSSPSRTLSRVVLPAPFGPDEADAHAPLDHHVDPGEDRRLVVVADVDAVQLGHDPGGAGRRGEGELGLERLVVGDGDALDLLQRLDPALDLAGLGRLVAEALDELLGLGQLLGLPVGRGLEPLEVGLPLDHELGEPADVLGGGLVAHLDDPVGHAVDEVPVVADEEDRAPVGRQVLLQPADGVDVEVVGGLVEEQDVGVAQQQPGQQDPHAPAAGELPDRAAGVLGREAEPAEDALGLGLRGRSRRGPRSGTGRRRTRPGPPGRRR